jgi:hypothetical protein
MLLPHGRGQRKEMQLLVGYWINNKSVEEIAPNIYKMISPVVWAKRMVAEALINGCWIGDINKLVNIRSFMQVLDLWEKIREVQISAETEDSWSWRWESNGIFSTKSVYHAHFATSIYYDATESIWNSSASIKWKLAAWIFLQGRLWTADRLAKRGLPHHDKCVFCNFSSEDAHHLFLGCAVVKIIWSHMLTWAGFPQIDIVAADQSLRC